jgi:thioredoxin reductase
MSNNAIDRAYSTEAIDLTIVGGGPAGMSAALVAGRAMLRTVIVNAENPRNQVTTGSHGFLTRDGVHPREILAVGKEQLAKYETVEYVQGTVGAVRGHVDGGFTADLGDTKVLRTKRIVIATGYRDDLSELKLVGIEDVYGRSVYPCVFCDGFEQRNKRLALFDS